MSTAPKWSPNFIAEVAERARALKPPGWPDPLAHRPLRRVPGTTLLRVDLTARDPHSEEGSASSRSPESQV